MHPSLAEKCLWLLEMSGRKVMAYKEPPRAGERATFSSSKIRPYQLPGELAVHMSLQLGSGLCPGVLGCRGLPPERRAGARRVQGARSDRTPGHGGTNLRHAAPRAGIAG